MDGMKIDESLIPKIVGIVVAIIVVSIVLIPVTEEVTATEDTFDNSQFARSYMKELEDSDSWTRSDQIWYYEGEKVTENKSGNYSILFTDNAVVREIANVRGTTVSYASNGVTSLDVTEDDSVLEITYNGTSNTTSFNYGFGAVPEGNYIMQTTAGGSYVLKDTVMYVTGITNVANNNNSEVICVISGSIKDGFTVTASPVKNATISDITIGEITVNAVAVDGYVDLYKITNIQFSISATYDGDTVSYDATYSTFVLPKEVTAEKAIHPDAMTNTIISTIPIFVVLAILMGIVGLMYFNRNGQ